MVNSWLILGAIGVSLGCKSAYYNSGHREYLIEANDSKIVLRLKGSENSPIVNSVFVVRIWNGYASITVDGNKIIKGKGFRSGKPNMVIDKDIVLWLEYESTKDTEIVIEAN